MMYTCCSSTSNSIPVRVVPPPPPAATPPPLFGCEEVGLEETECRSEGAEEVVAGLRERGAVPSGEPDLACEVVGGVDGRDGCDWEEGEW